MDTQASDGQVSMPPESIAESPDSPTVSRKALKEAPRHRKIVNKCQRPSHATPRDTTEDDGHPYLPPRPMPNSYWVTPQLLASEYPGAPVPQAAIPRLKTLLDAGIRDFYDLTHPNELKPYEGLLEKVATERGYAFVGSSTPCTETSNSTLLVDSGPKEIPATVRYSRFTIPDGGVPSDELLRRLLAELFNSRSQGRRAVIHCWGGIGRTGTIAACYLIAGGYVKDNQEALELLAKKWAGVDKSWRSPTTPETARQFAFVRSFVYQGL